MQLTSNLKAMLDQVRVVSSPSMMAWLNDYRPKKGKRSKFMGGILSGLKPRKGKYKPTCNEPPKA